MSVTIHEKVKIKKIILEYSKKEIELTEEQARGLYAELDKLFGVERNCTPVIPYPVPCPTYPPYYEPWKITW